MLSGGSLVRIAVIAAWTGLLGSHVADHAWPTRGDPRRLALAARSGERATYDLVLDGTPQDAKGRRAVGTCTVSCARREPGYRLSTQVTLIDQSFIPGFEAVRGRLGIAAGARAQVTLAIVEDFDAAPCLRAFDIEAAAGGSTARFHTSFERAGLHGHWLIDGGPSGEVDFPAFDSTGLQGLQLVAVMPPRMAAGDRFAADLLGIDALARAPAHRVVVYLAGDEETVTIAGRASVLRCIEGTCDGAPTVRVWCDRSGLVVRQRSQDVGISLELRQVDDGAVAPIDPATDRDP
ncbi:MAG: hypothetical protein H0W83_10400 [Planctomycetes bacterium]|nr:hypothetical protein [Planctomycetota bacterium]